MSVTTKDCLAELTRKSAGLCLYRQAWLLPILAPLLPHVLARLSADWTRVVATSGTQAAAAAVNGVHTSEAPVAAESEVIAERLLRELTAEHITLLTTLQDTGGIYSQHVVEICGGFMLQALQACSSTCEISSWSVWFCDIKLSLGSQTSHQFGYLQSMVFVLHSCTGI